MQHMTRISESDARTAGAMPVWGTKQGIVQSFRQEDPQEFAEVLKMQDDSSSFGFGDLIDMINPLQHIPILNLAYRAITGDEIKPIGKIVGGGVFGGPVGIAGGVIDAVITQETGKDIAGNAFSLVKDKKSKDQEDLALALLRQEQTPVIHQKASVAYEKVSFAEARTAGTIARYA